MLVPLPHEVLGAVRVAGVVPKLSRTPGKLHSSGGAVGRDTRQVLQDIAGLSAERIAELAERKTVKC